MTSHSTLYARSCPTALPIQYQYHAIRLLTYREKYPATEKNVQNTHYRYSNYRDVVHSRTTNEVTTCQKKWDNCINGMLLTSK